MVPPGAGSWVLLQPQAIFEHPRLGRALVRAFDDAGDRAMFERARRVGYDARTIERALIAWSARTTLFVGFSHFDTARVETSLWNQLLPPRSHTNEHNISHTYGMLGRTSVALAISNTCNLMAYSEGPNAARDVDQTFREQTAVHHENVLVHWHSETIPASVGEHTPEAVLEGVRGVDLRVQNQQEGLSLDLTLVGELPVDSEVKVRRAVTALSNSPLGEAVGTAQWANNAQLTISVTPTTLALHVLAPWNAVDALADVLSGRVSATMDKR
jgi:hypothetical protein